MSPIPSSDPALAEAWNLCCASLTQRWGKYLPVRDVPVSLLPLLGDSPTTRSMRDRLEHTLLLPVFYASTARIGRTTVHRVWRLEQDWEARVALIAQPEPAAHHQHVLATLQARHTRELRPQPNGMVTCRSCRQGVRLSSTIIDVHSLPRWWHAPDCPLRTVTNHWLPRNPDDDEGHQRWLQELATNVTTSAEMLAELATVRQPSIYAWVARNPNTPEEVLLRFLREDPWAYRLILGWVDATDTEHPGNPAMDLVLLANPSWFAQLDYFARTRITSHFDVPPRWRNLIMQTTAQQPYK